MSPARENLLDTTNFIPLARLSPELDALPGIIKRSPGYRKLADMVRDGSIRTELINGRYYARRESLRAIAQMVGMLPSREAKPGRPRRAAAASVAA